MVVRALWMLHVVVLCNVDTFMTSLLRLTTFDWTLQVHEERERKEMAMGHLDEMQRLRVRKVVVLHVGGSRRIFKLFRQRSENTCSGCCWSYPAFVSGTFVFEYDGPQKPLMLNVHSFFFLDLVFSPGAAQRPTVVVAVGIQFPIDPRQD